MQRLFIFFRFVKKFYTLWFQMHVISLHVKFLVRHAKQEFVCVVLPHHAKIILGHQHVIQSLTDAFVAQLAIPLRNVLFPMRSVLKENANVETVQLVKEIQMGQSVMQSIVNVKCVSIEDKEWPSLYS